MQEQPERKKTAAYPSATPQLIEPPNKNGLARMLALQLTGRYKQRSLATAATTRAYTTRHARRSRSRTDVSVTRSLGGCRWHGYPAVWQTHCSRNLTNTPLNSRPLGIGSEHLSFVERKRC